MGEFVYDTETYLIAPGRSAPNVVCLQWSEQRGHAELVTWAQARDVFLQQIAKHERVIGHHVSFDMAAMAATYPDLLDVIFDLYDANRVYCTMRRQQMLDTAAGKRQGYRDPSGAWRKPKYGMADMAARFLNKHRYGKKGEEDSWRLRYAELALVPREQWPADAVTYALDDVHDTRAFYELQEPHATQWLKNQHLKVKAFFALELMKVWGLRTDEQGVRELEERTRRSLDELQAYLVDEGLVRTDGSRDTKAAKRRMLLLHAEKAGVDFATVERTDPKTACAYFAEKTRMKLTDSGDVSLDAEACEDTEDPVLEAYAELTSLKAIVSKDVTALRKGVTLPIHTRYDSQATDRTSSSGPNVQNWSRVGRIRECFVPREGYVYLQGDFEGFELCALAETCMRWIGQSALATALNAGKDVHSMLGANMIHMSYDAFMSQRKAKVATVLNARQAAKPGNFGFPGGLGFDAFRAFSKSQYGVIFSAQEAVALKNDWLRTWPEMIAYFAYIRRLKDANELYSVEPLYFGQVRGGCTYTAACNTPFQALAANTMQYVLWHITRACYFERNSPLFGVCRPVNEIHDEYFLEVPDDRYLHERAQAFKSICRVRAAECMPLVPPKLDPVAMYYWSKAAHEMHDEQGRLVPWTLDACACAGCTEEKAKLAA